MVATGRSNRCLPCVNKISLSISPAHMNNIEAEVITEVVHSREYIHELTADPTK